MRLSNVRPVARHAAHSDERVIAEGFTLPVLVRLNVGNNTPASRDPRRNRR